LIFLFGGSVAKVFGPGLSFRTRGSVGRVQFRKTTRGNVVCLYKNKPSVISAAQAAVRACMSSLTSLWHTLDTAQLAAWRTYGAAFNSRWGGFAYFTYCNMPRCRAGLPLLSWPPGFPVVSSAWELDGDGNLRPADMPAAGEIGLWELVNVPDPALMPAAGAAPDSLWEVDLDGDLAPVSA
jgi:hypothetical protein